MLTVTLARAGAITITNNNEAPANSLSRFTQYLCAIVKSDYCGSSSRGDYRDPLRSREAKDLS
jgi:hypothetical protein